MRPPPFSRTVVSLFRATILSDRCPRCRNTVGFPRFLSFLPPPRCSKYLFVSGLFSFRLSPERSSKVPLSLLSGRDQKVPFVKASSHFFGSDGFPCRGGPFLSSSFLPLAKYRHSSCFSGDGSSRSTPPLVKSFTFFENAALL